SRQKRRWRDRLWVGFQPAHGGLSGQGGSLPHLESLPAIQEQRHGPIVHKLDIHHGPEAAGGDGNSSAAGCPDERVVELLRQFRRSRADEAGTATFATVAEQRELADDQERAADVFEREIYFALGIVEDPERDGPISQLTRI